MRLVFNSGGTKFRDVRLGRTEAVQRPGARRNRSVSVLLEMQAARPPNQVSFAGCNGRTDGLGLIEVRSRRFVPSKRE